MTQTGHFGDDYQPPASLRSDPAGLLRIRWPVSPEYAIYKNPFGLDPVILRQTFAEVANCRNSGILINTFMLARDYYLVDFVKRVSQICRGKAYFTSTFNLGDYLLMDFMTKKARSIH